MKLIWSTRMRITVRRAHAGDKNVLESAGVRGMAGEAQKCDPWLFPNRLHIV